MLNIQVIHIPSNARDFYSWAAILNDKCIGNVHLQIEQNQKIKFLDAWVQPEHRRKGIYRKLWDTRWDFVHKYYKGYISYAWCKPKSLPLAIEKGFIEGDNCVYVEKKI